MFIQEFEKVASKVMRFIGRRVKDVKNIPKLKHVGEYTQHADDLRKAESKWTNNLIKAKSSKAIDQAAKKSFIPKGHVDPGEIRSGARGLTLLTAGAAGAGYAGKKALDRKSNRKKD